MDATLKSLGMVTRTRLTRAERKEAKHVAMGKLVRAAQDAEARAQVAEAQTMDLQATLLMRGDGEIGGSANGGSAGEASMAMVDQVVDRLTCIAPRLHELLKERSGMHG